jgi:hypothetical protein
VTTAIASRSIASERPLRVRLATSDRSETTTNARVEATGARAHAARTLGRLEDAVLLLLLVLAFPLIILGVGAPVALVVRLVLDIARRW